MADTNPTLLDQIKRTDPDGSIADIVEVLTERNPILMDATAKEGNLPTGERVTVRATLPTPTWRRFNEGIDADKSETVQVDESTGMLTARSKVDCALARLNGNEAAFRRSEDLAHVASLNNEMAQTLFFGNVDTNPEEFQGFHPRYASLSTNSNIVNYSDAAYSNDTPDGTDNYRIWFITWHPEACYLIYPKGSQAGLRQEDMGKRLTDDSQATPKQFWAWVTEFEWQMGLVVKDWRQTSCVVNIDASVGFAALADITTAPLLELAMIEALNRIHDPGMGRTVCYMNRQVKTWLEQQTAVKATMNFSPVDWYGKQIMGFRGVPIITCDALATGEAPLT